MTRAKFEATHSSIKGPKKAFNQGYHKFESVRFEIGPKSEGVRSVEIWKLRSWIVFAKV